MKHLRKLAPYWSERLLFEQQRVVKRVIRKDNRGGLQTHDVPLFRASVDASPTKIADLNWWPPDEQIGWVDLFRPATPHWITLDTALLRRTDDTHPIIPRSGPNPIYEVDVEGVRYVVDGISLLQRMIAPREQLISALLSPFRELFVSGRLVGTVANVVLNRGSESLPSRGSRYTSAELSSIAFWCCNNQRSQELDRCAISIELGRELYLPQTTLRMHCQVRGIHRVGESDWKNVVYVQSLAHGSNAARARDVLWRDDWRTIRATQTSAVSGVEITDRAEQYRYANLKNGASSACAVRALSKEEAREVRELAGWRGFS